MEGHDSGTCYHKGTPCPALGGVDEEIEPTGERLEGGAQGDAVGRLTPTVRKVPDSNIPAWVTTDRNERLEAANEMLRDVASCGRKFFAYQDRVSRFELDGCSRIWFIDKYTQKRIYVQYKGRWKGFSDGGTLRALVERLRNFITQGDRLPSGIFGPWPEWVCGGDLWGYGKDMPTVRESAQRLGILADTNLNN